MFNLINLFRALFERKGGGEEEQPEQSPYEQRQEELQAQSGDNVTFHNSTNISENYKDVLSDAINFYQSEFKTTPRADIAHAIFGDDSITGMTNLEPDETGQHPLYLKHLNQQDEEEARETATESEAVNWHPRNIGGTLSSTPVHELGHALYATFFPLNDTSSNADRKHDIDGETLVQEALKDVHATDDDAEEYMNDVSGYAVVGGAPETIAESLVDYYYNRDNAADLSKAIVRRLKAKGSMRAVEQTGGFDTRGTADNFIKNLRRYRVIQ